MIILDILNPENDEQKEKEKQKIALKKKEILEKLPNVSLQIISIDGKIIRQ